MKVPDTNADGGKRITGGKYIKIEGAGKTTADFPINEKLLLDEATKNRQIGHEHIQFEADESLQHPEARSGANEAEETLLDEVARNGYPDIE